MSLSKRVAKIKTFGLAQIIATVMVIALSAGAYVVADSLHTISGQLTFNSNPATDNSTLSVGFGSAGHTSPSNGSFSISDVADGSYPVSLSLSNGSQDSGTTGEPDQFTLNSTSPFVTVNGSDVTQNLAFNTNKVTVTVDGPDGNPVSADSGIYIRASLSQSGTTTDANGNSYTATNLTDFEDVGDDGTATVSVLPGLTYQICAFTSSNGQYCTASPITVNSDTTTTISIPALHTISGQLTFNSNPATDNSTLSVGFGSAGHTSPSNGSFSISDVADGSYPVSLSLSNGSQDSGTTGEPDQFTLNSTSPFVTVNGSDVTQNLAFNTNKVTVTVDGPDGNPVSADSGIYIRASLSQSGTTTDANGNSYTATNLTDFEDVGDDGTATVSVLPGLTYQICAFTSSNGQYCTASPITVNSDTTTTISLIQSLTAPTNLSAPSPAQNPSLSWDATSGATSYNIYRNGTKIDSSSTNSYTDNNAPEGTDSYYVTAVNAAGESGQSNSVSVLVDRTAPTITYTVSPAPNSSGWNNSSVTVTFHCSDNTGGSGIDTCSPPVTLSTEGADQTVTGSAMDNAGNTATTTATVNIDESAPSITYTVSSSPNIAGWYNGPVTVTFMCSDNMGGSGIASCPPPYTVSADGANQTVTGSTMDNAGNTAAVTTAAINIDQTAPNLGSPSWSNNPAATNQATTLTVPVTDSLSGVVAGEYFIGSTDPGTGNGTAMTYNSGSGNLTADFAANSLSAGTYTVNVRAEDTAGNWSTVTTSTLTVNNSRQLTALDPAKVWVGLKNSDDVGVKFDLLAQAYAGNTLISSGELDSVAAGSNGFNNAKLDTIPFDSFSPVSFPTNTQLKVVVSVRNACTGSGHTSGTARLWYNDSAANSQFGANIAGTDSAYYLLDNFNLGTSAGSGPKDTIDVQSGAKCSDFKPFGTWSVTP